MQDGEKREKHCSFKTKFRKLHDKKLFLKLELKTIQLMGQRKRQLFYEPRKIAALIWCLQILQPFKAQVYILPA